MELYFFKRKCEKRGKMGILTPILGSLGSLGTLCPSLSHETPLGTIVEEGQNTTKTTNTAKPTIRKNLTKKQIKLNKKARYLKTKAYKTKQLKKERKQKDKEWATIVKKLQPTCLICNSTINLNSHHIISREIERTRFNILNGVTLCAKHHKWGIFSAHRNPAWFLYKLMKKQRESYEFVFNTIPMLELLESGRI